jgi:hypothetical protein
MILSMPRLIDRARRIEESASRRPDASLSPERSALFIRRLLVGLAIFFVELCMIMRYQIAAGYFVHADLL